MTAKKRHTFYYDPDDDVVADWLAAQDNASLSIRRLVRDAALRDGYKDLFDVLLSLPDNRRPGPGPRGGEDAQTPPERPDDALAGQVAQVWEVGPCDGGAPADREAARKEKLQRSMQNMIDGGR